MQLGKFKLILPFHSIKDFVKNKKTVVNFSSTQQPTYLVLDI